MSRIIQLFVLLIPSLFVLFSIVITPIAIIITAFDDPKIVDLASVLRILLPFSMIVSIITLLFYFKRGSDIFKKYLPEKDPGKQYYNIKTVFQYVSCFSFFASFLIKFIVELRT